MMPVALTPFEAAKPHQNSPSWWFWDAFERWLLDPCSSDAIDLADLGDDGPLEDRRFHVAIDAGRQTAMDTALFETRGRVYSGPGTRRLAIAVATEAALTEGGSFLGAERRLVRWTRFEGGLPAIPPGLSADVARERRCRIVFLTPAYLPDGVPAQLPEGFELKAACVPRHQTVSGWDFEHRRPKPTRRVVPAGTVLFVTCLGDAARIADLWLQPFGTDEESMRDGFGVAAVGRWRTT